MSNALQNRLVGTVILVAVTVIFLPDYLDGKKQTNTETFVDFPRSTSNLSAIAPETFPAEEVAKATRREVEIVDEEASDALYEKTQSSTGQTSANSDASNSSSSISQSVESAGQAGQSNQESSIAERMAKNVAANKAAANTSDAKKSSENANDESSRSSTVANNEVPKVPPKVSNGNSLAEQTIKKTSPDSASENSGWVVQLGSFGNQKNVNELLNKLEKAGYRSFSRKVQTSAGRLTKVFVGPELDKEKLDLALPHLKQTTGLTGKVTTFDVVSN